MHGLMLGMWDVWTYRNENEDDIYLDNFNDDNAVHISLLELL